MTLRLNGSTSGYTAIDAPASAGNNTLILPTGNGSSGQCLTTDGNGVLSFAANRLSTYAIIQDQKPDGTAGGTFTSGAWQTRTLNTIAADPDNIITSLSGNEFTLPSGSYLIKAFCPFCMIEETQSRIYNVTDALVVGYGPLGFAHVNNAGAGISYVAARTTISASKVFRIEQRCSSTRTTDGFGRVTSWTGNIEVYAHVEIYKEA